VEVFFCPVYLIDLVRPAQASGADLAWSVIYWLFVKQERDLC
jgi:hypothetical protein